MEKIVDVKFFGNCKKKSQKWPTQDLSNIERNKVMKNQSIQGIPRWLAYNNQPRGVDLTPPCRIGLKDYLKLTQSNYPFSYHYFPEKKISEKSIKQGLSPWAWILDIKKIVYRRYSHSRWSLIFILSLCVWIISLLLLYLFLASSPSLESSLSLRS